MRGTTLASWQEYSARFLQVAPPAGDSPAEKDARRIAGEVCRLTSVRRERAEQLAADCAARGEAETLLRLARRIGDEDSLVPWAALLDGVLRARSRKEGS